MPTRGVARSARRSARLVGVWPCRSRLRAPAPLDAPWPLRASAAGCERRVVSRYASGLRFGYDPSFQRPLESTCPVALFQNPIRSSSHPCTLSLRQTLKTQRESSTSISRRGRGAARRRRETSRSSTRRSAARARARRRRTRSRPRTPTKRSLSMRPCERIRGEVPKEACGRGVGRPAPERRRRTRRF